MKISQQKKKQGIYCCAYGCKNSPNPRKAGLCNMHYARKRKALDPVYDRYNKFKAKAKSRGIECSVTLEQFRKFCEDERYIVVKGRRGMNATIDRLCNAHGYHIWNMGIKTHRQNASKGDRFNGDNFECPF